MMKRFARMMVAALVVMMVVAMSFTAMWAAGSCAQSGHQDGRYLDMTWAGDVNGTVTGCNSTASISGYVTYFESWPGTAKPADNYDMTLKTMGGLDLAGGGLANRSETARQLIRPVFGAGTESLPVSGKVALAVTGNNSTATGSGTLRIWYQPYR
jgi:hypothetical protein